MSLSVEANELSGEVGELFASWLRRFYPDARAKRLSRDFGVAEATAKRWLAGHLPDTSILLLMLARWGAPFAAEVLAPTGPWTRVAALERDLERLGASLDEARRAFTATRAAAHLVVDAAGVRASEARGVAP